MRSLQRSVHLWGVRNTSNAGDWRTTGRRHRNTMHLPTYPAPTQQILCTGFPTIGLSVSLTSPALLVPGEFESLLSVPPLRLPSGVVNSVDRMVSESNSGDVKEDISVRGDLNPNWKVGNVPKILQEGLVSRRDMNGDRETEPGYMAAYC